MNNNNKTINNKMNNNKRGSNKTEGKNAVVLHFSHDPEVLSHYKSIDDSLSNLESSILEYDTIQEGVHVKSRDTFKDKNDKLKPYWEAVVGKVMEKSGSFHRVYYINKVQVFYKNFKNYLKKKGHVVDNNENLTLTVPEQKILLESDHMEARYDKFKRILNNQFNPNTKIKRDTTIMEAPQKKDITEVKKNSETGEFNVGFKVEDQNEDNDNSGETKVEDQNEDNDDEDTVVYNPQSPSVRVDRLFEVDNDTTDDVNHLDSYVSDKSPGLNDVEVKNEQLVTECETLSTINEYKELNVRYNDSLSDYSNLSAEHKKLGSEYKVSQKYLEDLYNLILNSDISRKDKEAVSKKSKADKHLKLKLDLGLLVTRSKEFTPEKFKELEKNIESQKSKYAELEIERNTLHSTNQIYTPHKFRGLEKKVENLTIELKAEKLMSLKFKAESDKLKHHTEIQAERIKVFISEKEQDDVKIENLQTKLNGFFEEDFAKLKEDAKKMITENESLTKTVQQKDEEILELNEAIRRSEANKTDGDTVHKKRVTDLEQEVDVLKSENECLKKESSTLKSDYEDQMKVKDTKIKTLQEKIISQAKDNDKALLEVNEQVPKKIRKARSMIQEKVDENIQLKQQHQEEIEKIKILYNKSKDEINDQKDQIDKLSNELKVQNDKLTTSQGGENTSEKEVTAGSVVSTTESSSSNVELDSYDDQCCVSDSEDDSEDEKFGEYGFPGVKSNNNQT